MVLFAPDFLNTPFSHRGYHDVIAGRPENSRSAFRAAIAAGYGIEMDLQLSSDDQAMVFHDYDLGRLTLAKGAVQQKTATALGQIPLSGGDEGIPTFPEVLELVAGQVPLLVELKDQHGQLGETDGRLEHAVAAALAEYNGAVAVMSFNPNMVGQLAALAPDIPRGLVTCDYTPEDWPLLKAQVRDHLRDIPDFARVSASFISHDSRDLRAASVAALKARGVPILCWTIRSSNEEAAARQVADNITFEGYVAIPP